MKSLKYTFPIFCTLFIATFFSAFPLGFAQETSPPFTLNYQGELQNANRAPLMDSVALQFRLYLSETEGEAIWQESHPSVVLDQGRFSLDLGITSPLPLDLMKDETLFLGLSINDNEELTPRLKISSALNAQWAQNATSASLSDHAVDVSGENIHPSTLSIGELMVIDEQGNWVGPQINPSAFDSNGVADLVSQDPEFQDRVTQNLMDNHSETLQGPQGEPGPQGEQGLPGADANEEAIVDLLRSDIDFRERIIQVLIAEYLDELRGPQGPQGPQGNPGIQGERGLQGVQGERGAVGPQGDRGPQGFQGDRGPQGERGVQGPQGEQGPQGIAGEDSNPEDVAIAVAADPNFTGQVVENLVDTHADTLRGEQGEQGERGPQGLQGERGAAGPQGDRGPQGIEGPQGVQGPIGPQGDRGPIGPQGDRGPQGPQGIQGERGERGPQGLQGDRGNQGPQGEQGLQGLQGDRGPQGEAGVAGPQGERGIQGIQGERGAVGPQGPQGERGVQGERGEQGIQGNRGPIGPIGAQGDRGPQGFQGERGIQGEQGERGPVGPQGPQGQAGEDADPNEIVASLANDPNFLGETVDQLVLLHADELRGEPGPQGLQGNRGPQGPVGDRGPQGLSGERGPQGVQGDRGPQGVQGLQGERGPQGFQGQAGPVGPQGERGPQGIQGAQGEPADPQEVTDLLNEDVEFINLLADTVVNEYFDLLKGEVGPRGNQGPVGPQGPQGEPGEMCTLENNQGIARITCGNQILTFRMNLCGNGEVDQDEECDDGNTNENDACRRCLNFNCLNYDVCGDEVDNDCDGQVDEVEGEVCGDNVDNDCDGQVDEVEGEICGDNVDNDCDGQVDEVEGEICGDNVDNDCDGTVDEVEGEICGDNVDNDCDGQVDEVEEEICDDGIDNDCDGEVDECGGGGDFLVAHGGWEFYSVPVAGAMSDTNVHAACQAAGLVTPCAGGSGCQYNNNICTLTSEVGCGNPMQTSSQSLCGTNPNSCPQFNGHYAYMGGNWSGGSACGTENGSWCTSGNQYNNRFALCARRQ